MVGVLILAAGAWIVFSLTVSTRWEGYVVPAEGMVTGAQEAAAARMAIGSFRSRAGCYEALQEFADASSYESDNFVLRCESSRSFLPF